MYCETFSVRHIVSVEEITTFVRNINFFKLVHNINDFISNRNRAGSISLVNFFSAGKHFPIFNWRRLVVCLLVCLESPELVGDVQTSQNWRVEAVPGAQSYCWRECSKVSFNIILEKIFEKIFKHAKIHECCWYLNFYFIFSFKYATYVLNYKK